MSLEEEYEYYPEDEREDFELSEDETMSCESDGDDYGEYQTLAEIPETNPYVAKRMTKLRKKMRRGDE